MWFVILALLIVAAYFIYDALRDRRLAEMGNSMSTAQRLPNTAQTGSAANYKNVLTDDGETATPQAFKRVGDSDSDSVAGISAAGAGATAAVAAGVAAAGSGRKNNTASGKLQFLEAPIGNQDDLTRIDGIGPVIEGELNSLGIYHYHQIGNFSESDVDSVNAELDFPGRIERENWISQARGLMTDASAMGSGQRQGQSANDSTAADQTSSPESSDSSTRSTAEAAAAGAAVLAASGGAVGSGMALNAAAASASPSGRQIVDSHANGDGIDDDEFALTDGDLTGAWNTDVMIEVQERLKVLNTRESDAPRLNISREDYRALKDDDDERFSRDELVKILDRLRALEA